MNLDLDLGLKSETISVPVAYLLLDTISIPVAHLLLDTISIPVAH
jgi:hypothetical protein